MERLAKRLIVITAAVSAVATLILFVWQGISWSLGYLVGALWMTANLLLTFNLWKVLLLRQPKAKVPLVLFIKFPVLYMIAYFILVSKQFPAESLLTGLGMTLLTLGGLVVCPKQA